MKTYLFPPWSSEIANIVFKRIQVTTRDGSYVRKKTGKFFLEAKPMSVLNLENFQWFLSWTLIQVGHRRNVICVRILMPGPSLSDYKIIYTGNKEVYSECGVTLTSVLCVDWATNSLIFSLCFHVNICVYV
jgi:hypothetical protein